jgi:hypothetical protein
MRNVTRATLKRTLFANAQLTLAEMITALARLKQWATRDSGTGIERRRKLFAEVLPRGAVGAEIGVFKGNLSRFILEVNRPTRLHLIDPWWTMSATWDWASGDKSTARSFAIIVLNLLEPIGSGQVQIHIGDDLQILRQFEDGYFDWVYVDTSHQYAHTRQELRILENKVKAQGIIAGDDWFPDPRHEHHGVYRAVTEFLAENGGWSLVFSDDEQWAIRRTGEPARSAPG